MRKHYIVCGHFKEDTKWYSEALFNWKESKNTYLTVFDCEKHEIPNQINTTKVKKQINS